MKFAIIGLALVVQQVVGDTSTELVSRASNQFANQLYQKIAKQPGNVLICPVSLHVALALVLQGANGNTETQLATALHLPTTNSNVKDGFKAVLSGIKDDTLKVATKLFPASGFQLNNDYVRLAQEYFLSDVEGVDFSNANKAAGIINKYVEDKTNNKIHDLIKADSISDSTKLVIINAVHFQAVWKKPFPTVVDDYFRVTPQERVKVRMMIQTDYFGYKEDPVLDAKVLKMDYNMGGYSMLFVLPNKEDGLAALEDKLANSDLQTLLSNLRDTKVEVSIPKFKLEQTINLEDILQQLGMKDLFTDKADLRKISSQNNLSVDKVIQKTFINVHENGTEAAAATAFLETLSANFDNAIFSARRPFCYFLIHNNAQASPLVLFEGRFVRPHDQVVSEEIEIGWKFHGSEESTNPAQGVTGDRNNIVNNQHGVLNHQQPNLNNVPTQLGHNTPDQSSQNLGEFDRSGFTNPTPNHAVLNQNQRPNSNNPTSQSTPHLGQNIPQQNLGEFGQSGLGNLTPNNSSYSYNYHQEGFLVQNYQPNSNNKPYPQNAQQLGQNLQNQNIGEYDRAGFVNPTTNNGVLNQNQPNLNKKPTPQSPPHLGQNGPQQYPQNRPGYISTPPNGSYSYNYNSSYNYMYNYNYGQTYTPSPSQGFQHQPAVPHQQHPMVPHQQHPMVPHQQPVVPHYQQPVDLQQQQPHQPFQTQYYSQQQYYRQQQNKFQQLRRQEQQLG